VAGYSAYNALTLQIFLARNPPLGKMYPVDGHKMHLYCIGSGEPTIVLEPGLGPAADVLGWSQFQAKLARATRVCSYDRAGLGWSEPQPGTRDADHVAANLHELLAQARVSGPLVMVGSSYGGIYIRDYAAHSPSEVAGLVLIDSSTPYQQERFAALAGLSKGPSQARRMAWLHAQYLLGVPRLMGWCGHTVPSRESRAGQALGEDACIAHYAGVREFLSAAQSSAETAGAGPFNALP
jgi:pimeloyl-ACP methyl ester carboxylesterase